MTGRFVHTIRLGAIGRKRVLSLFLFLCFFLSGCHTLLSPKTVILEPIATQENEDGGTAGEPERKLDKIYALDLSGVLSDTAVDYAWDDQNPGKLIFLSVSNEETLSAVRYDYQTGFYEELFRFTADYFLLATLSPGGRYLVYGYYPQADAVSPQFVCYDLVSGASSRFVLEELPLAWSGHGEAEMDIIYSDLGFLWSRNGVRLAIWLFPYGESNTVALYTPQDNTVKTAVLPRVESIWDVSGSEDTLLSTAYDPNEDTSDESYPYVSQFRWQDGRFVERRMYVSKYIYGVYWDAEGRLLFRTRNSLCRMNESALEKIDEQSLDNVEEAYWLDISGCDWIPEYISPSSPVDFIQAEGKQYLCYDTDIQHYSQYAQWSLFIALLEPDGTLSNSHLLYKEEFPPVDILLNSDASGVLLLTQTGEFIVLELQ